jgi:hypothetical protein
MKHEKWQRSTDAQMTTRGDDATVFIIPGKRIPGKGGKYWETRYYDGSGAEIPASKISTIEWYARAETNGEILVARTDGRMVKVNPEFLNRYLALLRKHKQDKAMAEADEFEKESAGLNTTKQIYGVRVNENINADWKQPPSTNLDNHRIYNRK